MHHFVRWIEIDLDAIIHNYHQIRQLVSPSVKIMSVVKADAYGHGALEVARALAEAGTDMFAVTTIEEALELTQGGITTPILVFAPLLPCQAELALDHGLVPTIDDLDALNALALAAAKKKIRGCFHLKIETGMGRTGVQGEELSQFLQKIKQTPQLKLAGVYSHFATAMMKDKSFTKKQLARFLRAVDEIKQEMPHQVLAHIANSAALLDVPESHLDMVRPGTLLYGQYPSPHVGRSLDLLDPFQMKGKIVSVKKLAPGDSVGYGRDYITKKNREIGIIPVGYADGFGVLPHTRPAKFYDLVKSTAKIASQILGLIAPNYVIYDTARLPVVGRIGMQLSMVDITGKGIPLGATVQIPIRRTTAAGRITRIYFRDQKEISIREISAGPQ
ncbi:MAG: alanine racemase [Dehalobacterium sp.]|jgi:alanine racemase